MSGTFANWIYTTWSAVGMVVISAVGIYVTLMIFTQMSGLRSFSKMSSFDFALTVAIGSLVASSILTSNPPLLQSIVALACIFGLQYIVSKSRYEFPFIDPYVNNRALLLMAGPHVLHENLSRARITIDDLRAKLREANVISMDEVRAVVLESTGDISVLHAAPNDPPLDLRLMSDVIDSERLRGMDKMRERDETFG